MAESPSCLPAAAQPAGAGRSRSCWPTWQGAIVRWIRWALAGYLLALLLMMFLENSLIYFPSRYPEGFWQPAGLTFEDAHFTADDGVQLHGWYVPHAVPRAAVLFCHGNAGNITDRDDILRALHERVGVSVLIFDYRGYGRSAGRPSEAGLLRDARAARAWLAQREGIAETAVVLMGESLGGAVAVDLAAADGARGLVLENTFSSLPDVAAHHYRWLPVRWLMQTQFDAAGKIGRYHGPLLQVHGLADSIVPIEFAQRLFAAANEPKQLICLPRHDHNDPLPPSYYARLAKFVASLPAAVTP